MMFGLQVGRDRVLIAQLSRDASCRLMRETLAFIRLDEVRPLLVGIGF